MSIQSLNRKKNIVTKFGKNPNDTGQTEVQIAILSDKIQNLTRHFRHNKKDNNSRRGLFKAIGKRKGLLKYLETISIERYKQILIKLNIRK